MPRFVTPLWLARMASPLVVATSKLLGTRPLVTPYALQIIACNYHFGHDKAKAELGYPASDRGHPGRHARLVPQRWLPLGRPCRRVWAGHGSREHATSPIDQAPKTAISI